MSARLDHLVVAAADLDWLCGWFLGRTGVEPTPGGAHDGWGTRNALVGLGPSTYLELIGPDPEQPDHGRKPRPFGINDLAPRTAELVTFAVAVDDLDAVVADVAALGLDPGPIASMSRVRPDGVRLSWRLATPPLADHGGVQPFTIEWGEGTPHPASSLSHPCSLAELSLGSPDAATIAELLERLGLEIGVASTERPMLSATINCPAGVVELGNR